MPFRPCCVNSACDWLLQGRHWNVLANQKPEYPSTPRPRSATEFCLLIGQNTGEFRQCLACINQSETTLTQRGKYIPPKVLYYIPLLYDNDTCEAWKKFCEINFDQRPRRGRNYSVSCLENSIFCLGN